MHPRLPLVVAATALLFAPARASRLQPITAAGRPAQLDVRVAGERTIRVTLAPVGTSDEALRTPNDGTVSFKLDDAPVLGMGEGGPRPEKGRPWRAQPVHFDRRGAFDAMEPRWQSDMYGSRNPAPVLFGTEGWGLFVAAPWVQVDLREKSRGRFVPWKPTDSESAPQTERNQQQNLGKGLPPVDRAVIYLGTGFCPRGWNTKQPSFQFNPDVFARDPQAVLADLHARHVKVVVHMVPWDRDRLPTLHGTIPARPQETLDAGHIQNYWQQRERHGAARETTTGTSSRCTKTMGAARST